MCQSNITKRGKHLLRDHICCVPRKIIHVANYYWYLTWKQIKRHFTNCMHPSCLYETALPSSPSLSKRISQNKYLIVVFKFIVIPISSVFLSLEEEKRKRKMGTRRGKSPVNAVLIWLMRQPTKVKSCLAVVFTVCSLVAMKLFVKNHDYFFVASEAIHAAGIMVLIYKLTTKNTCSGIIIYINIFPFNSFFLLCL